MTLTAYIDPADWMTHATCRGNHHLFFEPPHETTRTRRQREQAARQICNTCPVVDDCRAYARTNHEWGYWAGETETDRTAAGYPPGYRLQLLERQQRLLHVGRMYDDGVVVGEIADTIGVSSRSAQRLIAAARAAGFVTTEPRRNNFAAPNRTAFKELV